MPNDALISKFLFAARPSVSHTEIITGAEPAFSNLVVDGVWSSSLDSYLAYTLPNSIRDMDTDAGFTMVFVADITALRTWSSFICVPYRNGTWASPFGAFHFLRYSNHSKMRVGGATDAGAIQDVATSDTGAVETGLSCFAIRWNGSKYQYILNGVQYGADATTSMKEFNMVNEQPIVLGNRSNSDTGEGIAGTVHFAGITDQILTDAELLEITNNPLTFT
jgi:hypothetical protein